MIRNITVVFDDSDPMSVYKNRIFGFRRRSFSKEGIDQRAREAEKTLGTQELLDRKPKQLPLSKQQLGDGWTFLATDTTTLS